MGTHSAHTGSFSYTLSLDSSGIQRNAPDARKAIDKATGLYVTSTLPILPHLYCLRPTGSSDDTRPRVHEVDNAVAVQRHVLFRDHLDRLLRDEPAQERRHVRDVRRRRTRAAAKSRQHQIASKA